MGCNAKDKPKHRHSTVTPGKLTSPNPNPNPNPSSPNPNPNPSSPNPNPNPSSPNPNPNPSSPNPDPYSFNDYTEEELEDLLLLKFEFIHKEALARLISLNYDESLALHALLSNGHCYGDLDVISNVINNAIIFLDSGSSSATSSFTDLRHFQEYSLAGMVCMLQSFRQHITRQEALWCLFVSNLHIGNATDVALPSAVDAVMKGLEGLKIEKEETREMIIDMVAKIRDLEIQVRERKEWAQQKAMQAAKRLSSDLTELKVLRMESEENQRVKKGKQALEESTMKRLAEMEATLKKASGQVDRVNAVVHRLQAENAEIRAEMEACKLSAAESDAVCLEVAKRERKCLKRLLAWEKQRENLQAEVAEERKEIARLQWQFEEVCIAQKEAEVR